MSLIVTIIVALVLAGLVIWALDKVPMNSTLKTIIRVLIVIVAAIWILSALGVLPVFAALATPMLA